MYSAVSSVTASWMVCGPEANCGTCPDVCSNQCITCTQVQPTPTTQTTTTGGTGGISSGGGSSAGLPAYQGPEKCKNYQECDTYCSQNLTKCQNFIMNGSNGCKNAVQCLSYFGKQPLKKIQIQKKPAIEFSVEKEIIEVFEKPKFEIQIKNNERELIDYTVSLTTELRGVIVSTQELVLRINPQEKLSAVFPQEWNPVVPGNYVATIIITTFQDLNFSYTASQAIHVNGTIDFDVSLDCGKRALQSPEAWNGTVYLSNLGNSSNNIIVDWIVQDIQGNISTQEQWISSILPKQSQKFEKRVQFGETQALGKYIITVTGKTGEQEQKARCEIFLEGTDTYYQRINQLLNEDFQKLNALVELQKSTNSADPLLAQEMQEIQLQISQLKSQASQYAADGTFNQKADELFTRISSALVGLQALDGTLLNRDSSFPIAWILGTITIIIIGALLLVHQTKFGKGNYETK
ncbi:MAG: hypothetical protein Q7S92_02015 [Candidatus Diapherotrites archaeon]|nr:hypothetical protein [Candidatus Diapherotrites archaeon]